MHDAAQFLKKIPRTTIIRLPRTSADAEQCIAEREVFRLPLTELSSAQQLS